MKSAEPYRRHWLRATNPDAEQILRGAALNSDVLQLHAETVCYTDDLLCAYNCRVPFNSIQPHSIPIQFRLVFFFLSWLIRHSFPDWWWQHALNAHVMSEFLLICRGWYGIEQSNETRRTHWSVQHTRGRGLHIWWRWKLEKKRFLA